MVYIDSTVPVRKRFLARIDGIKESAKTPASRLRPVPGLGEGQDGEPGAYWLPRFSSLYVYGKQGWLTLLYTLEGWPDARRRASAVVLARKTLHLAES